MSEGPQVVHVLPDQEAALESHFRRNKNIHKSDVAILSAETGLDEELVQLWFSHRISSWRKEQGLGPLINGL